MGTACIVETVSQMGRAVMGTLSRVCYRKFQMPAVHIFYLKNKTEQKKRQPQKTRPIAFCIFLHKCADNHTQAAYQ